LLYWQAKALHYTAPAGQQECGVVNAWLRFGELAAPPGPREQPMLFLHERLTSRGDARLVAVEGGRANQTGGGAGRSTTVWMTMFQPGSLFSSPVELNSASAVVELDGPHGQVHWMAGQADPSDGSHFTIYYECGGKRHMVDGWLHDNDAITLEPRR
jgi:hypothetical protein